MFLMCLHLRSDILGAAFLNAGPFLLTEPVLRRIQLSWKHFITTALPCLRLWHSIFAHIRLLLYRGVRERSLFLVKKGVEGVWVGPPKCCPLKERGAKDIARFREGVSKWFEGLVLFLHVLLLRYKSSCI